MRSRFWHNPLVVVLCALCLGYAFFNVVIGIASFLGVILLPYLAILGISMLAVYAINTVL